MYQIMFTYFIVVETELNSTKEITPRSIIVNIVSFSFVILVLGGVLLACFVATNSQTNFCSGDFFCCCGQFFFRWKNKQMRNC